MISGVVFDLDGTLVDSWAIHLECLRRTAAALGLAVPSAARVGRAQRPTDVETLGALVGAESVDQGMVEYRRALRRVLCEVPVPPIPGAEATLEDLRRRGATAGVCTGRSREDAQALLDASGLTIDLLVAREDAPRPKPAPDGLLRAVHLLGLPPAKCLFVGDSAADAAQGRDAGIRTALVSRPGAFRANQFTDILILLQGGC